MTKTPFEPIITTQAGLEEAWRHLMGRWSFDGHSIWMMLIVDDRPFPRLTEITESEEPPDDAFAESLAAMLRMLDQEIGPGARFAFLRSRPGVDVITETDRAWATTLYAAARVVAVPCEVVHLATRGAVRPIPQDDVGVIAKPARGPVHEAATGVGMEHGRPRKCPAAGGARTDRRGQPQSAHVHGRRVDAT